MNSRRSRQFLILAFAVSLLLHVLLATGMRWPQPIREQETIEVVHVEPLLRTAKRVIPPPAKSPPPKKIPAATEPQTHPAKVLGPGKPIAQGSAAVATATAQPTAVPTNTPLPCTKGDIAAALAATPPPAEIPAGARGAATNGIARIRVTLDPAGIVQSAIVVDSSGNPELDLSALAMARAAQYSPALHACKPVAANYTLAIRFAAW